MAIRMDPRVSDALRRNEPVVALESAVVTHGLPDREAARAATELADTIQAFGAVPALVGLIDGELVVGLSPRETERLASSRVDKASLWNLPALIATRRDAGTTVAATLHACALSGIRVFATGGIGGVHHRPFDESADLEALSRYSVVTVCSGPKSLVDVAATLERLETRGVNLLGYRSDKLAGFYVRETDHTVPARCETPDEVADVYRAQLELGLSTATLVSNPVSQGLPAAEVAAWLSQAREEEHRLTGKDATPLMLERLAELSQGRTLEVNLRLLNENAAVAAQVAGALAARRQPDVVHA